MICSSSKDGIMQRKQSVSMSVIRRLPRYYRLLGEMQDAGIIRVSSKELAQRTGLTASQIRQDLNCFGDFGQQGYGYNVAQLQAEIGNILGLSNRYKCILIGVGNLGKAISWHMPFEQLGFELIGLFDNAKQVVGSKIQGRTVLSCDEIPAFCSKNKPVMAILCVPGEAVESIADQLYTLGVRSFWNFSHFDISMKYPDALVENVPMNDSMMTLCFRLSSLSADS